MTETWYNLTVEGQRPCLSLGTSCDLTVWWSELRNYQSVAQSLKHLNTAISYSKLHVMQHYKPYKGIWFSCILETEFKFLPTGKYSQTEEVFISISTSFKAWKAKEKCRAQTQTNRLQNYDNI